MQSGFIRLEKEIPDIQFSLRYSMKNNFMGEIADGYLTKDRIFFTKKAADQLSKVQKEVLKKGYVLAIYDTYRPVKAVQHFIRWSTDNNFKNKELFYPSISKEDIFNGGFISRKSAHSRGSTVDLTLIEKGKTLLDVPVYTIRKLKSGREIPFHDDNSLDMGSSFDLFDPVSFGESNEITEEQHERRMFLKNLMMKYGFTPYTKEWWHFVFKEEPFPDTYFDFDITK